MALIERLRGDEGFTKIKQHMFFACMVEMARGNVTRAQILSFFTLVGADVTQFDAIRDGYLALTTETDRIWYLLGLQSILELGERNAPGYETAAQMATALGI